MCCRNDKICVHVIYVLMYIFVYVLFTFLYTCYLHICIRVIYIGQKLYGMGTIRVIVGWKLYEYGKKFMDKNFCTVMFVEKQTCGVCCVCFCWEYQPFCGGTIELILP
jgi:hypothetical protein